MPKVLIFGTSYVRNEKDLWIARQWVHLARTLNPGADLLIVDSASPFKLPEGVPILQLEDNVGHHSLGGLDGWGRAFCEGLRHGVGYDWVVHIETDVLFARPMRQMTDRMQRSGVRVSAPWAMPYFFPETGLMFMQGKWLEETRLADRYQWRTSPCLPELQIEQLCGDELFIAPLRGLRDDGGNMDVRGSFHGKPDYFTHATVEKFRQFLEVNELPEV